LFCSILAEQISYMSKNESNSQLTEVAWQKSL